MRIGFIGNTNNYPFILARAMRKLGHEVRFIVTSRYPLDRPEYRYSDINYPYPAWIYDLSPIGFRDVMLFDSAAQRRITNILRDCDAVIANDFGPMLLADLNCPTIALLTGSDLDFYANLDFFEADSGRYDRVPVFLRLVARWIWAARVARRQRAGIRSAAGVVYFPRGVLPSSDRLLDDLGINDGRRVFNLMTDIDVIDYAPPPFNTPLRVFCGLRLSWTSLVRKGGMELDYKGAEIMVKGLAMFVRSTGVPLEIRVVRKGLHVEETIRLVQEVELGGHVTWLDEMSQSQVDQEYRRADIVMDQVGNGMIGMVSLDAMALGRPVIANARPEFLEPLLGVPIPICQARTPQEICEQINLLYSNPGERERIGLASRKFIEQHCSSAALARRCLQKLTSISAI